MTAERALSGTARIEAGTGIFTLINTFHVQPPEQALIADELAAVTVSSMQHLPGFLGASVHVSLDGQYVVNYVQWESRQHFLALFEDAAAQRHLERVKALAISVTPVFYEVTFVGARVR